MSDNLITIAGNLTRDPELRFTQAGKAVCNAAIAVNDRQYRDGQWVDGDPMFMNLTIWAQLGENVAASLHKGDRVIVRGRLVARNWEDQQNNKRVSYEMNVDEIGGSLKWATATYEKTNKSYSTNMSQPTYAPGPDEEPF